MRKTVIITLVVTFLVLIAFSSKAFWFEEEREPLIFDEAKNITVKDDGFKFNISTKALTVQEMIELEEINLGEYDLIFPSLDHEIVPGMNVEIHGSIGFIILADEEEFEARTFRRTVGGALKDAGIVLSHLDKINYNEKDLLQKNMKLIVT
jgi:uncharacterized protein YabE (DUF348 family)